MKPQVRPSTATGCPVEASPDCATRHAGERAPPSPQSSSRDEPGEAVPSRAAPQGQHRLFTGGGGESASWRRRRALCMWKARRIPKAKPIPAGSEDSSSAKTFRASRPACPPCRLSDGTRLRLMETFASLDFPVFNAAIARSDRILRAHCSLCRRARVASSRSRRRTSSWPALAKVTQPTTRRALRAGAWGLCRGLRPRSLTSVSALRLRWLWRPVVDRAVER